MNVPVRSSMLALALTAPGAHGADAARDALRRAYYEFEVASYCGLVSDRVGEGFRAERHRLEAAARVSRAEIERLRGQAWQAANAEWQNRGLGGFRGWCRTDGRAAAERFARTAPRVTDR